LLCPKCKSVNSDDAKFCNNCGATLNDSRSLAHDDLVNSSQQQNKNSSNRNTLIICLTVIVCVVIVVGALLYMNQNNASDSNVVNNTGDAVNNSSDDTSDDESSSKSSGSGSGSVSYSQALAMYPDSSSDVITNAFDEADSNKDGMLSGSEVSEFKRLAKLASNTASDSNSDTKNEKGKITRYCTTHGRVTTGSDLKCPYCEAEGLDSRTVKGSTEYN